MNKDWIELVSKMETYNITPYEINKSIIEFAKAILELEKYKKDSIRFGQTHNLKRIPSAPAKIDDIMEEDPDQQRLPLIDGAIPDDIVGEESDL